MTRDLVLGNVAKRFGGVVALENANLSCDRGEVHGLVGENGAGKTTLVKILAGALSPDAGDLQIDGLPLELGSPRAAFRAGIGTAFQELSVIEDLSVGDNIFFGHRPGRRFGVTSRRRMAMSCEKLFEWMELDGLDPDARVGDLPLAKRQLVEVAKAVSRKPRVLVLDEATSALGREQTDWLMSFVRRLAAAGGTVIYISHKLSDVLGVCDRVTVFRNGTDVGTRDKLATADELIGMILGQKISRVYPERVMSTSAETSLEVRDLASGSGLHGVSFSLRRGEILGVGGLSGQGQDLLFRSIFGTERATGQASIDGQALPMGRPGQALAKGIALVPEDRARQGLLLSKSIVENISLSSIRKVERFGFIRSADERRLAESAVVQLNIKVASLNDPVRRLSGGNQQKVVIAKLLAVRPRVLMLFDSTRGVDVGTKAEIFLLLRHLAEQGTSILFYSTDTDELVHVCHRVLVMRAGRIQAELEFDEITERNIVRAALGESVNAAALVTAVGQ